MEKQKKWSEMTNKEKKKNTIQTLIMFVIAIPIIIFTVNKCVGDKYDKFNDLSVEVQILSDDLIKTQLKYPDGYDIEKRDIIRKDSITYIVNAIVLAKNGFGVRGRMLYTATLEFVGSKSDSRNDGMNKGNWNVKVNKFLE